MLGELLMVGIAGPKLTAREISFLKRVRPAGVIYFRRNIKTPSQVANLSRSIRAILGSPLIAIDQEGGRVWRLKPPFTVFPSNDLLGKDFLRSGRLDLLRKQVRAQAEELKAVGINYNFVPVADVNSNPRNPIIGDRAFSTSPAIVARLVAAMVKAYRSEGIVSCAKHFPGHGDTFSDSHKKLPTVRASRATILKREIPPFRAAIRAGVPTLMTAHVVYSALDRALPATLSPYILETLLRRRLRFRGVCVSDDLEMAAIARHRSIADAALDAIRAGVDLLLVCKSLDEAEGVYKRLGEAVRRGELPAKRAREALARVSRLKKAYVRHTIPKLPKGVDRTGWVAHREIAERVSSIV